MKPQIEFMDLRLVKRIADPGNNEKYWDKRNDAPRSPAEKTHPTKATCNPQ